ncbi:CREB/ATF bZIP transcription factor-like [Photinus pyralis]|uniref:BZIP domain-containing protein n=1 Tax=Photinus pyralis TaxID=7054 RepID=A0A1Y1KZS9_PHOPY|nr:CREB/ATF bZIP transcription factor-like [Photinus pyralis]
MAKSRNNSMCLIESDYLSSEDEGSDASTGSNKKTDFFKLQRKEKCTSRNAILARQNRIRKKMYIQNLENKIIKLRSAREKLNSIVQSQSVVISELRTEVKYIRSVLANSSDLSKLIRNISNSSGMSVTTSLDKSLTVNNCVSKLDNKSAHPWDDTFMSSPLLELPDLDLPDLPLPDLENIPEEHSSSIVPRQEHNYTKLDFDDDPGVCLHVSKHKVSLEFCSQCNDNACQTWKELD